MMKSLATMRGSLSAERVFFWTLMIVPSVGVLTANALVPVLAFAAVALLPTVLPTLWRNPLGRGRAVLGSLWPLAIPLLGFAGVLLVSCQWSLTPDALGRSGQALGTVLIGGILLAGVAPLAGSSSPRLAQAGLRGLAMAAWPTLLLGASARGMQFLGARGIGGPQLQPAQGGPDTVLELVVRWATHCDRGMTVMALLLWPALLLAARAAPTARRSRWVTAAVAVAAIGVNYSLSAKLALLSVSGLLLFSRGLSGLGMGLCAARRAVVLGVTLVVLLTTPAMRFAVERLPEHSVITSWQFLPGSALHRLVIWHFAAQKVAEKPLLGWGYESSRLIGQKQRFESNGLSGELLPLHPHSFAMQIWLELGAVGMGLFLMTMSGLAFRLFQRAGQVGAPLWMGSWAIAMVSYGAWQSWWLCTLWLIAAVVTIAEDAPQRASS